MRIVLRCEMYRYISHLKNRLFMKVIATAVSYMENRHQISSRNRGL